MPPYKDAPSKEIRFPFLRAKKGISLLYLTFTGMELTFDSVQKFGLVENYKENTKKDKY